MGSKTIYKIFKVPKIIRMSTKVIIKIFRFLDYNLKMKIMMILTNKTRTSSNKIWIKLKYKLINRRIENHKKEFNKKKKKKKKSNKKIHLYWLINKYKSICLMIKKNSRKSKIRNQKEIRKIKQFKKNNWTKIKYQIQSFM